MTMEFPDITKVSKLQFYFENIAKYLMFNKLLKTPLKLHNFNIL